MVGYIHICKGQTMMLDGTLNGIGVSHFSLQSTVKNNFMVGIQMLVQNLIHHIGMLIIPQKVMHMLKRKRMEGLFDIQKTMMTKNGYSIQTMLVKFVNCL